MEGSELLVEHHVRLVGFEQLGGQLASGVDQFAGGVVHRRAALLQRP
jgi:hypothetical protein